MLKIILLVSAVLSLSGCVTAVAVGGAGVLSASADSRSVGTQLDDVTLKTKIDTALFLEKDFPSSSFAVYVVDGVVFVIGNVNDREIEQRALLIISEQTSGEVVNYIRVDDYDSSDYVVDSAITARVKMALLGTKDAPYAGVGVETVKGEVFLFGKVSSSEKYSTAEDVAKKAGAKKVNNNLIIKSSLG